MSTPTTPSPAPSPPLEPVLRWEDLASRRHWPSLSLTLDDALIRDYCMASGEDHPAFGQTGPAAGFAPALATTFVRFAKASLGGRWPTGTLQMTQAVQSFRALRRGETLALELAVAHRTGDSGRQVFELLTTLRDAQGLRVGTQSAALIWWRPDEFDRVARVQRGTPSQVSAAAQAAPAAQEGAVLLGPLSDSFSLQRLQAYGALAGARDPIHVDPDFAASTPSGANIAQGKLIVTPVARLMHAQLGQDWLERGGFNLRLRRPVKAGETVRAWARERAPGQWQVWCDKPDGERVIEGEAVLLEAGQAQAAQRDA